MPRGIRHASSRARTPFGPGLSAVQHLFPCSMLPALQKGDPNVTHLSIRMLICVMLKNKEKTTNRAQNRPGDVFGERTHDSLGVFLSPVFGKVKTTAGTNPRFVPVGVDIATRGILALSPAS